MPEPIYFQWQNSILLKSIYPLRSMKLRDFLVFYYEIDIWKEYKGKQEADLKQEIETYKAAQVKAVVQALADYNTLRDYFIKPVVNPVTERITRLHKIFQDNYPLLTEMRKERIFVITRILELETAIKEELQRIRRNSRRILIFKTDPYPHNDKEVPVLEQENQQIEGVILPAIKNELKKLNDFLSSISRIEKRKTALAKKQQERDLRKKSLIRNKEMYLVRKQPLEMQRNVITSEIARIEDMPDYASLEAYFLNTDVFAIIRQKFPDADRVLIQTINGIHARIVNILRFTVSSVEEARGVGAAAEELRAYKDSRETSKKIIALELQLLDDFRTALRFKDLPPQEKAAQLNKKKSELGDVEKKLAPIMDELAKIEQELSDIEAASRIPEEEQILQDATPPTPSNNELAKWKADNYRTSLQGKTDDQLLELVTNRILAEPDRFPRWLQYMVVHFSGMRYRSAHGSWADPKDLLFNLRSYDLEKDFKGRDAGWVDSLCTEKLNIYQAASAAPKGISKTDGNTLPTLDQATEKTWRDKINHHLKGLSSPWPHVRREALFNLMLDEENYVIQKISSQEALAGLEKFKKDLPPAMWKEIEGLTLLRLNTTDEKWEELSPDEQTERNQKEWSRYREILNKWKADNLTEWRSEHELSSQLIVTRAVCNEIAEHIQHIRGNSPGGGLTAKPYWYKGLEGKATAATQPEQKPFFRKALSRDDFKPGASILWLRFVKDYPNQWRIANPITLSNGEGLLPAGFLSGQSSPLTGGWSYGEEQGGIKRTRTQNDANNIPVREEQWLRWIHEATVIEVAETAEGMVVLTFETALPYEDRNTSTIGVFKHYLGNLVYAIRGETFNGTFLGFAPEGDVPSKELDVMLDWNRILRRQRLTQPQWEDYRRKYIWKDKTDISPVPFTVFEATQPPQPNLKTTPRPPSQPKIDAI